MICRVRVRVLVRVLVLVLVRVRACRVQEARGLEARARRLEDGGSSKNAGDDALLVVEDEDGDGGGDDDDDGNEAEAGDLNDEGGQLNYAYELRHPDQQVRGRGMGVGRKQEREGGRQGQ